MAIDSHAKRRSAAGVVSPWSPPALLPDGTIAALDRQHAGWSYAGIAASGPPPPPDTIRQAGLMVQIGKLMNR